MHQFERILLIVFKKKTLAIIMIHLQKIQFNTELDLIQDLSSPNSVTKLIPCVVLNLPFMAFFLMQDRKLVRILFYSEIYQQTWVLCPSWSVHSTTSYSYGVPATFLFMIFFFKQ